MKKTDMYEIAIKLLGLYLVVAAIGQLRDLLMYVTLWDQLKQQEPVGGGNQLAVVLIAAISFIVLLFFIFLLVIKTRKVIDLIGISKTTGERTGYLALNKQVYEMALTIIGLTVIVFTLPDALIQLKVYIQRPFPGPGNADQLISSGLKTGIGILALSYARPLSALLVKEKSTPETGS